MKSKRKHETNLEMTKNVELVDKDIKTFIITVSYMFKKLETRLNMMVEIWEIFKNTQIDVSE